MNKVLIYGYEWTQKSGGIVALHKLAELLNEANFDVSMTCFSPVFGVGHYQGGPVDDDTLVIYPEVVQGNPLKAKRVMRYILAERGYWNVAPGDEILCWSVSMRDHVERQASRHLKDNEFLRLPITDTSLFNHRDPVERKIITTYECTYPGGIEITQGWPLHHYEMAGLFKQSLFTVVWRTQTSVVEEALLCGTPVLTRGKMIHDNEYHMFGLTDDHAHLEKSHAEVGKTWYAYHEYLSKFPALFGRFLDRIKSL